MRTNRVTLCVLAACLVGATLAIAAEGQPSNANDERAIRAVIDKINLAMSTETEDKAAAEIMRSVISDKGYTLVVPRPDEPSEAIVGDKKALLEFHSRSLRDGHVHKVQHIAIVGPIAYEIGETIGPERDGKAQRGAWLNVFAKEDRGWKLIFGTPADDFRKAMRQLESAKKADAGTGKATGEAQPELGKRLIGTWIGKLPAGKVPPKTREEASATFTLEVKASGKMSMTTPDHAPPMQGTWKVVKDEGDKLTADIEFEVPPAKDGEKPRKRSLEFAIEFANPDRMTMYPAREPNDKLTFDRKK